MYKNILHNPTKVTDEEIEAIQLRRKKEKTLILERDLDKVQNQEKYWFMIANEWLFQWKCFISNKLSKDADPALLNQVRVSENEKIGVLPPGPISNHTLFVKNSSLELTIKANLQLNKDYRGVNKEVWQIFHRLYSGGPIIIRESLDIYSQDLSTLTVHSARKIARKQTSDVAKSASTTTNIFAKKVSPRGGAVKKKRNLFMSENIGYEDDEAIAEERIDSISPNVQLQLSGMGPGISVKSQFIGRIESMFNRGMSGQ